MLRKSFVVLFVLLSSLTLRSPIMAQGFGHNFPVPENHWAYAAVTELMQEGILEGYPDGTFRGKRAITRNEFAAAMRRVGGGYRVRNTPYVERLEPKTDYTAKEREARLLKLAPDFYAPVPKDHWAYAAMRDLQKAGLWEQFGNSTSFDGKLELKRSAFATMLLLADEIYATLTLEVKGLLNKLREEFRIEISALAQVEKERSQ